MPKSKHRKNHEKALAWSGTRPPPGGAGLPVVRRPNPKMKDFSDIADRDYKGTKVEVVQGIFNDIRGAGMVPNVVCESYYDGSDDEDGRPWEHMEIGMTCPHGVMGDSIGVISDDLVTWEADERSCNFDGCLPCGRW